MSTQITKSSPADSLPGFLERHDWYRALPSELRILTLETAVEKTAVSGQYIARAGQPTTDWYGLIHGLLQMYVVGIDGSETTLYCLREGEWCGDGSLLKNETLQYDLRALTPAHICMIPAKTFQTLRLSSIAFNHFLCDIMNERMGVFVGMLAASRLLGPDMRVASALLMLADDTGEDTQELLIPQHELALICGLSRQRVNIAISGLKQRGFVQVEPRKGLLVVCVPLLHSYVMAKS